MGWCDMVRRAAVGLLLVLLSACRPVPVRAVPTPPVPLQELLLPRSVLGPNWMQVLPYNADEDRGDADAGMIGQFRAVEQEPPLVTYRILYYDSLDAANMEWRGSTPIKSYPYPPNRAQYTQITCTGNPDRSTSAAPMPFCTALAQYGHYRIEFSSHIDGIQMDFARYQQLLQFIDQQMIRVNAQ